MIELYFESTPNAQRALIALEEARLPYTLHRLNLFKGDQNAPAFRELNPLGAVPVLTDTDGPNGQSSRDHSIDLHWALCCREKPKFDTSRSDSADRNVQMDDAVSQRRGGHEHGDQSIASFCAGKKRG